MDEDTTWYGSIHLGPGRIVIRPGPSSPRKGYSRPLFSAHVYCDHGRPSQLSLLLSSVQTVAQKQEGRAVALAENYRAMRGNCRERLHVAPRPTSSGNTENGENIIGKHGKVVQNMVTVRVDSYYTLCNGNPLTLTITLTLTSVLFVTVRYSPTRAQQYLRWATLATTDMGRKEQAGLL